MNSLIINMLSESMQRNIYYIIRRRTKVYWTIVFTRLNRYMLWTKWSFKIIVAVSKMSFFFFPQWRSLVMRSNCSQRSLLSRHRHPVHKMYHTRNVGHRLHHHRVASFSNTSWPHRHLSMWILGEGFSWHYSQLMRPLVLSKWHCFDSEEKSRGSVEGGRWRREGSFFQILPL